MLTLSPQGATASTDSAAEPTPQPTARQLHSLGYAEPNDWSRPISTGRANEVMAILTRRIAAP